LGFTSLVALVKDGEREVELHIDILRHDFPERRAIIPTEGFARWPAHYERRGRHGVMEAEACGCRNVAEHITKLEVAEGDESNATVVALHERRQARMMHHSGFFKPFLQLRCNLFRVGCLFSLFLARRALAEHFLC